MSGRGRGRGRGAKRSIEAPVELDESNKDSPGFNSGSSKEPGTGGQRKAKAPRIVADTSDDHSVGSSSAMMARVGEPPGQHLQIQPVAYIDSRLLGCYGGLDPVDLIALDFFFNWCTQFVSDDIIQGLSKLSYSMRVAVDNHQALFSRVTATDARLDALHDAKIIVDRELVEVKADNIRLKVHCFASCLCFLKFNVVFF
jgi:hypothetical protein